MWREVKNPPSFEESANFEPMPTQAPKPPETVKNSDILKALRRFYLDHDVNITTNGILGNLIITRVGTKTQKDLLSAWIRFTVLNGHFSYGQWMYFNHRDIYDATPKSERAYKLREGTLSILEWSITYWEQKENEIILQVDGPQTR